MSTQTVSSRDVTVRRRALTVEGLIDFVAWSSEVIGRAAVLMPELGLGAGDLLPVLKANSNWMSRLWFGRAGVDRAALGLCAAEAYRTRMRRRPGGYDRGIEGPVLMPRFTAGEDSGSVSLWRTDTNRNIPHAEGRLVLSRDFLERHVPQSGLLLPPGASPRGGTGVRQRLPA
jgi:hypothetical protein